MEAKERPHGSQDLLLDSHASSKTIETFMKIDYFNFLRSRFKRSCKIRFKIKDEKTLVNTDKTKGVELIVLRTSRTVASRDHFLNHVL